MIFNEKGCFNKQAQWMKFNNYSFNLLSNKLTVNIDNQRLLSKMSILQSNANMIDKLYSIYAPYLKNWSAFNGLSGDV